MEGGEVGERRAFPPLPSMLLVGKGKRGDAQKAGVRSPKVKNMAQSYKNMAKIWRKATKIWQKIWHIKNRMESNKKQF